MAALLLVVLGGTRPHADLAPPIRPAAPAAAAIGSADEGRAFWVGVTGQPEARVALDKGGRDLVLLVQARSGDTLASLGRRFLDRNVSLSELQAANPGRSVPRNGSWYRVPFATLSPEWKSRALRAAFPQDGPSESGWMHRPSASPLDTHGEGAWQAAVWFTGSGDNFNAILRANGLSDPLFGRGREIVIPADLLLPSVRKLWEQSVWKDTVGPSGGDGSESGAGSLDDRAADALADPMGSKDAARTASALAFSKDDEGAYAAYRLKAGEALYSSVVVRFTGRVDPDEVAEAAEAIAKRSGIRDMTRIPAGFEILIPRSMVLPEFLPSGDPSRQAVEAVRKEAAKVRNPVRSRNLEGIHVILDAGHGGVDPGAIIGGVAEHEYVYDVMCRVKRILERETSAIVHPLIEDPSSGFTPRQDRALRVSGRETILTSPEHVNGAPSETTLGVNLRWYLANSILRRMVKSGIDSTRVVFASFHADVLHPSLRGAMVYVPGERYRRGRYGCHDAECARYAEVREAPSVRFSKSDRVVSEGLSRQFAGRLVNAFTRRGIRVHPYQPVRDRIIRRGRAWLPAVLRGNVIPVKVLVEVANLNNASDRSLMKSAAFRESVARAFTDALLGYYRLPSPPSSRVAERRRRRP